MPRKQIVQEYDVIRIIAILLVVLGHCDFLWSHGFDVTNEISLQLTAYTIFNHTIRAWIYSFHMPLFMILSGALYAIVREKYSMAEYAKNRFRRLILPYFLCGTFFAFPIKYLCGYFGKDSLLKAYAKGVAVGVFSGHLWFLWVLFVISIAMAGFIKIAMSSKKWSILVIRGGATALKCFDTKRGKLVSSV